jgi:hypothetical protein
MQHDAEIQHFFLYVVVLCCNFIYISVNIHICTYRRRILLFKAITHYVITLVTTAM